MKAKGVVTGLGAAVGANDGSLNQTAARKSKGAPMKCRGHAVQSRQDGG